MKIKYIFKKLKSMRYKELFKHAKMISKKINKSTFFVLFDMVRCAVKYGSGYMDYFEFEFYLLNKDERETYLTGRYNNEIVKKYNKKEDWYKLDDKVEFNKIFKDYLGRDYIDLRNVSYKEFKDFISNKEKIVAKPLNNCGGKGIEVIDLDKSKLKNEYNILKIYNSIMKNEQFLVEEYIIQHEVLNKLYSGSVNSLRVFTFLDDNGNVQVLNVILRIGNNGSVDNFSAGGMYTFVDESGVVFVPAIDEKGNVFEYHPSSNEKIVGFKIPNYNMIKPYMENVARAIPSIRYVGWDLVVTNSGFVLIEGNQFPGVFQVKPSISGIKTGDLIKYRKYMDI